MVRKSYIVLILMAVLILPLVFAVQTTLRVKTKPNHNLTIYALEPVTGAEKGYFKIDSDEAGDASVEVSSESGLLCFSITVKKDGKIINSGRYGNYTTGESVFIDMTIKKPEPEPAINETATNETEVNETTSGANETVNETQEEPPAETQTEENNETNETADAGQLTGGAIGNKFFFSRMTYIIIAGAFLCLVVMFFVIRKLLSRSPPKYYDYKVKGAEGGFGLKDQKQLLDAEKKIKEAQEEILQIKDKEKRQREAKGKENKIKEAEERFEKAKEDLRNLRKGKEEPPEKKPSEDDEDEDKDSEDHEMNKLQ